MKTWRKKTSSWIQQELKVTITGICLHMHIQLSVLCSNDWKECNQTSNKGMTLCHSIFTLSVPNNTQRGNLVIRFGRGGIRRQLSKDSNETACLCRTCSTWVEQQGLQSVTLNFSFGNTKDEFLFCHVKLYLHSSLRTQGKVVKPAMKNKVNMNILLAFYSSFWIHNKASMKKKNRGTCLAL